MYFKLSCPSCDKNLKVTEKDVGRKARCPYCKTSIVVPSPPTAEIPGEDEAQKFLKSIDSGEYLSLRTRRSGQQSKRASARLGHEDISISDVSMLRTGLAGLVITVLLTASMVPFREFYLGELLLERGWVPFVLVLLTSWSLVILAAKARKIARQRESMLLDLLPTSLSKQITVESIDKFQSHIRTLPLRPAESFLINRVSRGLEHFRVRQSAPEVATILTSQSEIDATTIASSYTIPKVFIWAIPILGFIGTVIGISSAVSGFSGTLDQANDINVLKQSLNNVTGGLATAFDTTLIALVMSLLVKFPASSLQKREEDLLNSVDEYCNENLLKRLDDGGAGRAGVGNLSPAAIEGQLRAWHKKLEAIGEKLSQGVVEGWERINTGILAQEELKLKRMGEVDSLLSKAGESMRESAQTLTQCLGDLDRGLSGLNDVLEQLGKKQVVFQQPPRKSWLFWRRNGS